MSKQYPGGIITKNPTAPTTSSASGIWTAEQAQSYSKQGIWPRVASAPTIGTATAGSSSCASITFSAPSCVGAGGLTYKVISTPGCVQNTGASSPIVVSGLTNGSSYTFKAYGVTPGGTGPASAASNSITAVTAGSQSFISTGSYTWVAPTGVTSVSVVAVGAGSCSGGALVYGNNITVIPGNSYPVVVGAGNCSSNRASKFDTTVLIANGGGSGGNATSSGSGKSGGGNGGANAGVSGGGGAGGYTGQGGNSRNYNSGLAGAGGGGGGGGGYCGAVPQFGGGGGGVGILGQGCSGAGGYNPGGGGGGGSGGAAGQTGFCCSGGGGGAYGGGQGYNGSYGANGAVRIIWPGTTRSFPSTNTSSP